MIANVAVNTIPTKTGKVRLVCQICGRMSSPRSRAGLGDLPDGWSIAPYPADFQHPDSTTGDTYQCPAHSGGGAIGHAPREYLRPTDATNSDLPKPTHAELGRSVGAHD
ncbi:hypothetical protein [Microbacterium halotolerans]|uniref:hypothetical protein n=1 Tax=Microbacterium halotolerans TaxID=246613 RepID=UPI000E6AC8D8|nr:hypothetical protein [Microbacterium halotolerans]